MEAIKRLESMLMWSDRLGSDEQNEIREIIKILKKKNEVSSNQGHFTRN